MINYNRSLFIINIGSCLPGNEKEFQWFLSEIFFIQLLIKVELIFYYSWVSTIDKAVIDFGVQLN